jgi:hypothetical protein
MIPGLFPLVHLPFYPTIFQLEFTLMFSGTKPSAHLSHAVRTEFKSTAGEEQHMKRTLIGLVLFVVLATAMPGIGQARPCLSGDVSVDIVSDAGSIFQSIRYQEGWKSGTRVTKKYLEAKKGDNYGIAIRNNSSERIGVVVAVDGRNIISGEKSELGSREVMYIVNPYEHAQYDGWRTTDNEVHRFYFTEPDDSYSVRTFSDSSAMGVIAVAVYREKDRPLPLYEMKKEKASPAPSAPAADSATRGAAKALAEESVGTGFGQSEYSPVVRVEFEPERIPVKKTLIKYEWRETLCRKGIIQCREPKRNRLWDDEGYAPYPPGYPRS